MALETGSLSLGAVRRETGVRAPSLVTLRDIQRKAVETGFSLPEGQTGESRGGGSFTGHIERQ